VLALSLGVILLLTWLIKHGEASKVISLFYLIPPATELKGPGSKGGGGLGRG
jgi:hypothetical protein